MKALITKYIKISVLALAALIIAFLANYPVLQNYLKSEITIKPEHQFDKNSIAPKNLVGISGTPNEFFILTSLEGNYYFSLKEFGFDFLIKANYLPSSNEVQKFEGITTKIENLKNKEEIVQKLNAQARIDNNTLRSLDRETVQQIIEQTAGNFNNQTIFVDTTALEQRSLRNVMVTILFESVLIFLSVFIILRAKKLI